MASSSGDDGSCVVTVHPETEKPTKTWNKMKKKQKAETVTLLSPDAPIREDHIRFVCISDTHTKLERQGPSGVEFVPPGDVLLHAGDFTYFGKPQEIIRFNGYLDLLPHRLKVIVAGNHEMTMDLEMVRTQRQYLSDQHGITEAEFETQLKEAGVNGSRELLTNCMYLEDSGIDVCGIRIYGSPWQPGSGEWGFNLARGQPLLEKWNLIPDDTDILITHGPPLGHRDMSFEQLHSGCVELLSTIQQRVKPRYHVFGHIHEAYGVTSDGYTTYINASTCTLRYEATNSPVVFDFPIPDGHTKAELDSIPKCNL